MKEELKRINRKCEYVGAVGQIVQEFPFSFSLRKGQLGKSNFYTDQCNFIPHQTKHPSLYPYPLNH